MNSVIKKAAGLSECWFWSELSIMKWTEWNYDSGLSLFSHHYFSMENGKEQVLFLLWRQSISFVDRFPNLAEEYTLFHSWTGLVVFTVRWLCCFNLETLFQNDENFIRQGLSMHMQWPLCVLCTFISLILSLLYTPSEYKNGISCSKSEMQLFLVSFLIYFCEC